jgi:hypothetical protein
MSNQLSASYVKKLLFVAAAGVGALAFIPRASAASQGANPVPANSPTANAPTDQPLQNQPNVNQNTAQTPHLPDGFVAKDEDAASGVRTTLVQLTQRAVAKDSYDSFFSGFLSDLAKRDKVRAREFTGVDQAQLNQYIGQIQTEWRAKYGQDFDPSDKNLVFNDQFPIVQGEVSDPATATANWPATATAGQAITASSSSDQQQCNAKELTTGRAVAIIRFPAAAGLPDIDVSMIHQRLSGWYVDLPADRTGGQIYSDISSHLNYLATHQDNWPSDVNEGYRMVARNVAAALYGVSSPIGASIAQ